MSVQHEVFFSVVRMADVLTRSLGDMLGPFRLTISQYSVLQALRGAGEHGLACGEIASRLLARDPDITRLLDRLESRGLVLRRRERPDRRVVRTEITREGLGLLERLDALVEELQARHLGRISNRDLGVLSELLKAAGTRA